MRILAKTPICPLGLIADDIFFSGWLEQRSDYCSEASLYDTDDYGDDEISERDEPPKNQRLLPANKENSLVKIQSLKWPIRTDVQDRKDAGANGANIDSSEEDEPQKSTDAKFYSKEENNFCRSKSLRPGKRERSYGKLKQFKETQGLMACGVACHKAQATKPTKNEPIVAEAEDTLSASSHDGEIETKAQDKLINHMSTPVDLKARKRANEEEQRDMKMRRRKLVVSEDEDEEGTTPRALQKRKGMKNYVKLSSDEQECENGITEDVHKGSVRGTDAGEKVQFVGKYDIKFVHEAKRLKIQFSGRSKPDVEVDFLAKYLGKEMKKDSLQKITRCFDGLKKEIRSPVGNLNEKARTKLLSRSEPSKADAKSKNVVSLSVKGVCASMESSAVENQRVDKDSDSGAIGEEVSSGVTEGGDTIKDAEADVGWVLCDDCHKWRCIPAELADSIEESGCHWTCKENPNKKFADCSIPQEKSNSEINAELNISEVSICEGGDERDPSVDSKALNSPQKESRPGTTWTLIQHNIFQHRRRKALSIESIDEVMVCECVPPEDGGIGCGDSCHNRMVNIECTPQLCPCGDLCSNQQFQKRSYVKLGWFRCGKKGFGLQVLEDVPKGSFIIEYVGEVLDMVTYEARQREYAAQGQKHFYFMTLNGSEVIDACVKGNLGRFINHSCEPNCITEKWMVRGEVCIGLFAICDLKKGEEVTFDYNFVRVRGAAAKKCLCGSAECRGFIGGDPKTPQAIVESDFDEDDPEPVMMEGSSEEELGMEDTNIFGKSEACAPDSLYATRKWILPDNNEKNGASSKRVKMNRLPRKLDAMNLKRLSIESSGASMDGVEEILNEMLDGNGGICKRQLTAKEAATQYLKLLMQTAASGDEASRSIRDLSMVLDAILKTLSRVILTEILQRNGLQLLHNLIKQSRKNYKMTPITRKLLKVLDFLAAKNILTREQINAEPVRHGAQSVRDTIFHLCRHADSEVQQIANRFKEKWLLYSSNKACKNTLDKPCVTHKDGLTTINGNSSLRPFQKHSLNHDAKSSGDDMHKRLAQTQNDEVIKKPKKPSRWDKRAQEALDPPLADGLPPSFWPFSASNLLEGKAQQQVGVPATEGLHSIPRNTGCTSASDELTERHRGTVTYWEADFHQSDVAVHAGSAADLQQPLLTVTAEQVADFQQPAMAVTVSSTFSVHDSYQVLPGPSQQSKASQVPPQLPIFESQQLPPSQLTSVASGIPVGQGLPSSSISYVPQQMSVCIGIPITHIQGAGASRQPDQSTFSWMHDSSYVIHEGPAYCAHWGQATPVSQAILAESPVENTITPVQVEERLKVTCGISMAQFFQQMHSVFGSAFHPWQLQSLMAPHSWGPDFTDDARHWDFGSYVQSRWDRKWNGVSRPRVVEPDEPLVHEFAPEELPSHPQCRRPSSGRQYNVNEWSGSSNMYSQQNAASRSWKGSTGACWSKFPGHPYRNFRGHRKDFNHSRKQNCSGPSFSTHSDSDYRDNMIARRHSNDKMMGMHAERMSHFFFEGEDYEEASNCMPLEKPWGFSHDSSDFMGAH